MKTCQRCSTEPRRAPRTRTKKPWLDVERLCYHSPDSPAPRAHASLMALCSATQPQPRQPRRESNHPLLLRPPTARRAAGVSDGAATGFSFSCNWIEDPHGLRPTQSKNQIKTQTNQTALRPSLNTHQRARKVWL